MDDYYDFYNYSTHEDLEESQSTDQNDQALIQDYLAAMKARSLLEDQIIQEEEEEEVENTLSEDSEDDTDHEIPPIETKKRTPCVIVDNSKGEIGRCNSTTTLVSLSQLIGTWEIGVGPEEYSNLAELGVCSSHFNFDHIQLHSPNIKATRKSSQCMVHTKKCLLCNKYKRFFSRGNDCIEHCWNICGRDIQVPCLGLKSCPAFQKIQNISSKVTHSKHVRYICTRCFEINGGHLHKRQGSGKKSQTCVSNELHAKDTDHVLKFFSNWLLNLSCSKDEEKKKKVLWHMMRLLETSESNTLLPLDTERETPSTSLSADTERHLPSLLLVKTAMKINMLDNYSSADGKSVKADECRQFGEILGNSICDSRKEIEELRDGLENPASLDEYYNSFPPILTSFFDGLIESIEKRKYAVRERKNRQRGKKESEFDTGAIKKITSFLAI